MIYIYVHLQQERVRKLRMDEINKLRGQINMDESKLDQQLNNKENNNKIADMDKVFADQEEIKYLTDEQEIANIINTGERTPLNTMVDQALIQQRRGRPEQSIHIVDQSLRQSPGRITAIQTNLVNLPLSYEAAVVDASNPYRDSVRPVRN